MARTDDAIIQDIANLRAKNRALYEEMKELVGGRDATLEVIALAYAANRQRARQIHTMILEIDEGIMNFSRELAAKTCE